MVRKLKIVTRIARDSDLATFRDLETMYGDRINRQTRLRVCSQFMEFMVLNGFNIADGTAYWIGAQRNEQVKWSTLDTYLHYIKKFIKARVTLPEFAVFTRALSLVELAHANEDSHAALVASWDDCNQILMAPFCVEQMATLAIRYTGLRLADLRRLKRKQYSPTRASMKLEVRVTKNRRQRRYRRILRIPCVKVWGHLLPTKFVDYIKSFTNGEQIIFSEMNVVRLNNFIKSVTPRLSSYSFRKRFISDIAAWKEYDWSQTIRYSLHCDEHCVAAHYDTLME